MRRYVKRYPLVAFFAIAIGLIWGLKVGMSLFSIRARLLAIGTIWSPSIAGFVVASAVGGTAGLRQLWDQALTWRASLRWYLFVFVGFPALMFCIFVLTAFVTDATFSPGFLGVGYTVSTFVFLVVLGVPGEELFGWRGFALPRMLDRWEDLTTSVLLGVGWWLWHLSPAVWLNISSAPSRVDQPIFFVGVLGLAIVMTWVYRNTGSALLAGVGVHVAVYFPEFYVASFGGPPIRMVTYSLAAVLALIVVAVYGTKRFSLDPPESLEENPPRQQTPNEASYRLTNVTHVDRQRRTIPSSDPQKGRDSGWRQSVQRQAQRRLRERLDRSCACFVYRYHIR